MDRQIIVAAHWVAFILTLALWTLITGCQKVANEAVATERPINSKPVELAHVSNEDRQKSIKIIDSFAGGWESTDPEQPCRKIYVNRTIYTVEVRVEGRDPKHEGWRRARRVEVDSNMIAAFWPSGQVQTMFLQPDGLIRFETAVSGEEVVIEYFKRIDTTES